MQTVRRKVCLVEIVEIYDKCLYSVVYDAAARNEYQRIMHQWHDLDFLDDFFNENACEFVAPFWQSSVLGNMSPEELSERVSDEAYELENHLKDISSNTRRGVTPDLDSHFKPLGGKYSYAHEYMPAKSYGPYSPSLLRLYAIQIVSNCYVIVYGGIKLGDTIQNSPGLKDLFAKIDYVVDFLRSNGIIDSDDI